MDYLKPRIAASWIVEDLYASARGFASVGPPNCDGRYDSEVGYGSGSCPGIDSLP